MALEQIHDHFGPGLTSLAVPYWGKPRVAALLRAYLRQVELLEATAWDVLEAFDVRTADFTRLKILGKIVGQPPLGFDLETYRAVIQAKIATNRSRGLESDLLTVWSLITGSTAITLNAFAPAAALLVPKAPITPEHMAAALFLLPKARPAGVQQHVFFAPDSADDAYDYSSDGIIYSDAVDPVTTPGSPWFDARLL